MSEPLLEEMLTGNGEVAICLGAFARLDSGAPVKARYQTGLQVVKDY